MSLAWIESGHYNGPDRRRSPEAREKWAQKHIRDSGHTHKNANGPRNKRALVWGGGGIAALLIAAFTGVGEKAIEAMISARPVTVNGHTKDVQDLRRDLDRHLVYSETVIAEWRRDQQNLERYRERMDERTIRIERKLDMLLAKQGVRISETAE